MRIIVIVILFLFLGCGKDEETKNAYSEDRKIVSSEGKQEFKIIIKSCLVVKSYGNWASEGQHGFRYDYATRGYNITVLRNDEIFSTQNCPEDMLDHYLDLIKYKLSVRDSLIN
jgi:hypothetical protein